MSRRAINWSVAVFALAWFGVLVPVHNRGQIAPFGARTCADDHACCPDAHAERVPAKGAPNPGRACAVCFFIAGLHTPPPPTFVSHTFVLAGSTKVLPPARPDAAALDLHINSRGPPAA